MGSSGSMGGSPPHMRGKAKKLLNHSDPARITPAYAGKSAKDLPTLSSWRDHPRVCGEKSQKGIQETDKVGSPPRMRGKEVQCPSHLSAKGITPAYAGKRSATTAMQQISWDHPRVCGEKETDERWHQTVTGSPPRMRGKACAPVLECQYRRITPAYAGKSGLVTPHVPERKDHPRVCGEKPDKYGIGSYLTGSPPRMRGKGILRVVLFATRRITPAYAGKRFIPYAWYGRRQDHPRVCGEKTKKIP